MCHCAQGKDLVIFKDNNGKTPSKGPKAWLLDLANFLKQYWQKNTHLAKVWFGHNTDCQAHFMFH